ncbi:MAG: hypothetical protein ABIR96_06470 [Bdellovibrionota bacterium]
MKIFPRLGLLLLATSGFSSRAGELVLFANPSIRKIRWDTPSSALITSGWSQVHNQISHGNPGTVTAAVGHVVVHFACRDSTGLDHDVWTGMTGQNDALETKNDLLTDEIGIGVLFKSYTDGAIDPNEKSRNQVANYYGRLTDDSGFLFKRRYRVAPKFLRVSVDTEACDRMVNFYATFKHLGWNKAVTPLAEQRKKPLDQLLSFGFTIDPYSAYLKRVSGEDKTPLGGGCSSFALAFLKLSGHFDPIFEARFSRTIAVSEKLIGGKYGRIAGNKVSVLGVLAGHLGRHWTFEGVANRSLRFYDVQNIWDFIAGAQTCFENSTSQQCPSDIARWMQSSDVSVDTYAFPATRTEIRRTPLPQTRGAPPQFKEETIVRKIRATRDGIRLK